MQSNQPFFSNDWQGAAKVFATFGSMILVIVGVIVKWGQSAFKERLDKAVDDIEAIGTKVDEADKTSLEEFVKSSDTRDRVTRLEIQLRSLETGHGRNEASIDTLEKQVNSQQGSMLIAMTDQLSDRDEKITKLEVAAGRLDERLNMAELIRRFFSEGGD
jgi:hypothetical protein